MKKEKLILIAVLSVFIVGMIAAPAAASHKVKVDKYKGKITNKQYKKLKTIYKKDKRFKFVSTKATNKKHHTITIQYMNGYSPQSEKNFKRGFYGNVMDARYGMDGIKLSNHRVIIR